MTRSILSLSASFFMAGGLLLASSPAAPVCAQSVGTMPGTPGATTTDSQTLAERSLAGALLSNLRAETKFSKLALKNSSDPEVKKIAKQVISENRELSAQLATSIAGDSAVNTEAYNFGQISSRARQTEQELKKLRGQAFDKAYATAMDQHSQIERKMIQDNSAVVALSRSRIRRVTTHIRANSDSRAQQLRQVAQSENFTLS